MKTYAEALTYLYELPSFQYWRTDVPVELPDLNRFRALLRRLGSPQGKFQSVHIAGTKGKGSVSAIIASILQQAGYRVGLYTSPHLHTFRERIQVNGEYISEAEVVTLARWIQPVLEAAPATTFEAITAVAFEHFRRSGVEIAVLEVGLGGRFDATNVVRPLVSAITSIGLDHLNILGTTIPQIASEKAGILKRYVPVVFTPQKKEAADVLASAARTKKARQVWVGKDWRWERESLSPEGQHFTVYPPNHWKGPWSSPLRNLCIPLLGRHQLDNATAAVAMAAEVHKAGLEVSEEGVREGLEQVHWPARLEVLQERPWLIVDAAHTVESVEAGLAAIKETLGRPPDAIIFGVSDDKDVPGMTRLMPASARLILCQSPHPRAMSTALLYERTGDFTGQRTTAASPAEALEGVLSHAREDDVILVFGSIFLAAAAREAWFALKGLPMPPTDPV